MITAIIASTAIASCISIAPVPNHSPQSGTPQINHCAPVPDECDTAECLQCWGAACAAYVKCQFDGGNPFTCLGEYIADYIGCLTFRSGPGAAVVWIASLPPLALEADASTQDGGGG